MNTKFRIGNSLFNWGLMVEPTLTILVISTIVGIVGLAISGASSGYSISNQKKQRKAVKQSLKKYKMRKNRIEREYDIENHIESFLKLLIWMDSKKDTSSKTTSISVILDEQSPPEFYEASIKKLLYFYCYHENANSETKLTHCKIWFDEQMQKICVRFPDHNSRISFNQMLTDNPDLPNLQNFGWNFENKTWNVYYGKGAHTQRCSWKHCDLEISEKKFGRTKKNSKTHEYQDIKSMIFRESSKQRKKDINGTQIKAIFEYNSGKYREYYMSKNDAIEMSSHLRERVWVHHIETKIKSQFC